MKNSLYIHKFDSVDWSYDNGVNKSLAPQFEETLNRRGWVNFGSDNLYPDYLISLLNRSSKHNAIIKRKAMMLAGNGWETENKPADYLNFISNSLNELNLNDIIHRVGTDYEVFGGFAIEVIYTKDRARIAALNYIPFNKCRLSDCRKFVYYSDDWTKLNKFAPIKKPMFDLTNPTSNQILYVKEYRPGNEYYPTPDYLPIVPYCELEYDICLFHLNQVKNGFAPSMVITFNNGIPSDDEMKDVIHQLQNDYQGAMNSGKVMFLFSDGQERAPQITPIQLNNSDERFVELNREITQGILTGHQITNPGLFGISVPGELGQKSIILESLEIFQSTYVEPKQKMLERIFNKLAAFNGITTPLILKKYTLDLEKINQ